MRTRVCWHALLAAVACVGALSAKPLHGQSASPLASTAAAPVVGAPLPPWTRGTLDIHQLSTGRGNSALVVMPDGTTMLVDAGDANDGIPETPMHPDSSRRPGEWIVRYVQRHLPEGARALDYALVTHFHADHYGVLRPASPRASSGAYRLTGITAVGDALPIGTLIDRGWPAYDYPEAITDATMANYRAFVDAHRARGMRVARFQSGSREQIVPRDRAAFPQFEVRNVIGNGVLWTGTSASDTRALFPAITDLAKQDWPTENMCSLGIRISYGAFRFFTGGDLPGAHDPGFPEWHDVESALAPVLGPVSVHVVNHHGSMGVETDAFLRALASRVLIVPSWSPSHVAPDVLKRIVNSRFAPSERFVFVTDMRPAARTVIGTRANALAGPPGHVVVRVEPGGARYRVMVLSHDDERDIVTAVRGPFASAN